MSNPLDFSAAPGSYGFSSHRTGGHMARSMMLEDLGLALASVPVEAHRQDYHEAITDKNVLGKPTFSSRQKSYRHLVELYGLDADLLLFRELRRFAAYDKASLPLLAVTCTFCRDVQLRASFELISRLRIGELLTRDRMEKHLEGEFPRRFSTAMKKSLAQNVNKTWTGSGHLVGSMVKKRAAPRATVAATTYAMLAGYMLGLRGEILLSSVFGRLVGADASSISVHLSTAARNGWVRYRSAGGVREVDFSAVVGSSENGVRAL